MNRSAPFGQKYIKKTRAMRRFLRESSLSPSELLIPYRGKSFRAGLPKSMLFVQVLACQISDDCERYLNWVLGRPELKHHRDGRTPVEYGMDLVLGWLKEDAVVALLGKHGMSATLSGSDRRREFLGASSVNSEPDLTVFFGSASRKIEVVYDASGTWKDQDRCDLRGKKLERVRSERGLILGVDILNSEAFVYNPHGNSDLRITRKRKHGPYQKSVFSIHGISAITSPLCYSFSVLAKIVGGVE